MPKRRRASSSRRRLTMPHLAWLLYKQPELARILNKLNLKLTTSARLIPPRPSPTPMGASCQPDLKARFARPPASRLIVGRKPVKAKR